MGQFGIGTYQSISGGTTVYQGAPVQPFQNINPLGGTFGGTYGFVVDTRIRSPQQVMPTPAPEIGLDAVGNSIIRGFPSTTWNYNQVRSDFWYYMLFLYNQSARNLAAYQYLVLIQYPDQANDGAITQKLARMDPPTQQYRDAAAYHNIQLKFTYIGQATLNPNTPIVVVS